MKKISQKGIDLICNFEGCWLEAYLCPAKVWTIGYGHTRGVKQGDKVTVDQARVLLAEDLAEFEAGVNLLVTSEINQAQFDALVSFAFNLGLGNLKNSTLLRRVNSGDHVAAAREFSRWTKAAGKELRGLVARRQAEAWLYLS